jgi:hypothetical protein
MWKFFMYHSALIGTSYLTLDMNHEYMARSHINENNAKTFIILTSAHMAICSAYAPYECNIYLNTINFPSSFQIH